MRLTGKDVEQALVETMREQAGGPFDWPKAAVKLNERLADRKPRPFMLSGDRP